MPSPGDPLLFYSGAAMCLAVAGQAALGAVGAWRSRILRRLQSDADAEAFRIEVHAAAESARARLARKLAWEGRRTLRVSAVVDETADVKSLFLTSPDGRPLPRFIPGQYLTLSLPAGPGGDEVVRCYSLSDRPRPEYYRLSIRRQDAPTEPLDIPAGVASCWLHRHARVGMTIECEAPKGAFFYNPGEPRPAVLIGAGVGVTPLVSMLEAVQHARLKTPTYAFFGFRDGASHLFADEVNAIAEASPLVRPHYAYSKPNESDRFGVHYHSRGHVSLELLRRELPSNNFDYYLCGPGRMMQTLVPELLDWGVPEDSIHFEAFGPASVTTKSGATLLEKAIGSPVCFGPGATPIVWDGANNSLLEMAEAAGVPIGAGCRAGNCGACKVRVIDGKVNALRKPGVMLTTGECLACISLPEGPVVLDAGAVPAKAGRNP
jgi:ferredoxin-NADP reductase/ferredoxin